MEGREKPHMVKYKAITNYWNYDACCTLTSLPVWDFENFKRLVFVVQSVHICFFYPVLELRGLNLLMLLCRAGCLRTYPHNLHSAKVQDVLVYVYVLVMCPPCSEILPEMRSIP
jgi:hypothetical protein